jgi:hypothetical protein
MVSIGKGGGAQPVSARQWSSGFLPGKFQGVQFQTRGDAVHYVGNPDGVCQSTQRLVVEEVQRLNGLLGGERVDPEIQTRISQYELAFRMQTSIPELTDLTKESRSTLDAYGIKEPGDGSFAANCLLARRMVERGVRFVQVYSGDTNGWDAHSDLEANHGKLCLQSDKPIAGLLTDLKRRGLLDSTLVVWGGEFGRTPMSEKSKGRDHNPYGFSMFLAGGGVRGGLTFGTTDEFGLRAIENRVHVHDLHATILHVLGLDHRRLTFLHDGRDERLTVNGGRVVKDLLA